jgi:hypothetical protein
MIKKTLHITVCIFLCIIISISCKTDRHNNQITQIKGSVNEIVKPIEINKVNFYFENSGSMNGIASGYEFFFDWNTYQELLNAVFNNFDYASIYLKVF